MARVLLMHACTKKYEFKMKKKVYSVFGGKNAYHFFYINTKMEVFAFGYNTFGQTSTGDVSVVDHKFSPQKCIFSSFIKGHIYRISCGDCHSLFLTNTGQVLSCGQNSSYQCSDTRMDEKLLPVPQQILSAQVIWFFENRNIKIVSIEAGHSNSFFIDNMGDCYGCGVNTYYELGVGETPVVKEEKENKLQSWLEVPRYELNPKKVIINEKIKKVCALRDSTYFLTTYNNVYLSGCRAFRKENSTTNHIEIKLPSLINYMASRGEKVIDIDGGGHFVLLMSESRKVYGFGESMYGELNWSEKFVNDVDSVVLNPFKNYPSKSFAGVTCGHYHCLFQSLSGDLISFGWTNYGQLGAKTKVVEEEMEAKYFGHSVVDIIVGFSQSFVVDITGKLYACGENGSGQLGMGTTSRCVEEFTIVHTVKDIAKLSYEMDGLRVLKKMMLRLLHGEKLIDIQIIIT